VPGSPGTCISVFPTLTMDPAVDADDPSPGQAGKLSTIAT
jgi:hypothetical protein